jgi:uncharacterized membrane protein YccC
MPAPEPPPAPYLPESALDRPRRWDLFQRTLTHYDRSKVNLARGVRNTLGVAVPLIAGAMIGRVQPAIVMATGALNVGFADSTDPYLPRGRRMLAACMLVSLAVFCGSYCGWTPEGALAAAALWSFGAGMLVCLGTQIGNLGVTSTCVLLIFASRPLPAGDAALCGLLALGGGLVQTLLSIAPWPSRPYEPERLALASLYLSLAGLSTRPVTASEPPPATGLANDAREVITARAGDHSLATSRFRALLDQAERIRACLVTLRALRARIDATPDEPDTPPSHTPNSSLSPLLDQYLATAGRALDAAGEILRTGRPYSTQPTPVAEAEHLLEIVRALPAGGEPGALIADIRAQMDALTRQLRITFDLANNATPSGSLAFARTEAAIPWRLRAGGSLTTLRANLNLRSTAFRHALRLAAGVTAADALGRALGWNRPYWLPLTVTVVLKPDFSSTYSRGILRFAGTFAGLGLATALFHLLPRSLPVEIGLIMAATFVLRWTGPAHYGVLAMSVSELVVLLAALAGVEPSQVIMARARNTAVGGTLALLAYWLWPTWERTQIGEIFARMLDAYRKHFELITRAFSDESAELTAELDSSRSAARLARTNLDASVDRLAAEPASTPEERDRWQARLTSSHILAHSIIMLHASLLAAPESLRPLGQDPAFQDFVRKIGLTLESLAAVLRGANPKSVTFPDLREVHYRLVHSGEPMAAPHGLISVEADKMVNSLNTLREQVVRSAGAQR